MEVEYGPTSEEQGNLKFRRSLFAVKDIRAGEKVTAENVRSIRPSGGMKPKFLPELIGKTAKYDIKSGTPLRADIFEK